MIKLNEQSVYQKYTVLIILSIFSMGLSGQNLDFDFDHLSKANGINAPFNHFIYKDSRGYIWISSMGGLHRYNGDQIVVYKEGNPNSNGFIGANIQSPFQEDDSGNLWFSTYKSIVYFDHKNSTFKSIQFTPPDSNQVLDAEYRFIFIEGDSLLYSSVGENIYQFDLRSQKLAFVTKTVGVRFSVDTTDDGRLKHIISSPWHLKAGFEMISFDHNRIPQKNYYLDNEVNKTGEKLKIFDSVIDKKGKIWLLSNNGLYAFDINSNKQTDPFSIPEPFKNKILRGSIFQERYLLLSGLNSGIWSFDTKALDFSGHFYDENGFAKNIASNNLYEVYIDRNDHLWVSDYSSADIYNSWLNANRFKNPFKEAGSIEPKIKTIVEDQQKVIWCLAENEGVYQFDINGQFLDKIALPKNKNALDQINGLSTFDKGKIWGYSNHNIYFINPNSNKWKKVNKLATNFTIFGLIHINSTRKHLISNKGIFTLEKKSSDRDWTISQDSTGKNLNDALFGYKGNNEKTYYYKVKRDLLIQKKEDENRSGKTINIGSTVYAIHEELDSNYSWIGTALGLWKLNEDSMSLDPVFKKNHALHAAHIYSITKDKRNQLWLSTNIGLWTYDLKKGNTYSYSTQDGVPTDEFVMQSSLIASNGSIWLGASNGLVVFNPDSISPYPYTPNVNLERLIIKKDSIYGVQFASNPQPLTLRPGQNTLNFQVRAMTSYLPKLNKISYKLEGYDSDWTTIGNAGKIQYNQLPPGNYRLAIKGINANGKVGPPKYFSMAINWPFYLRFGFWLVSGLLIVLLGIWVIRRTKKRALEKQKEVFEREKAIEKVRQEAKIKQQKEKYEQEKAIEKAKQEERNRISGEMHDEMGSRLASIGVLIDNIKRKKDPALFNGNLNKIEQHANILIENMRDIIWAMNNDYDDLGNMAAYFRRHVVEYFDEHELNCKASIERRLPEITVGGRVRRNIFLCVKEACHNVVKHAKATEVGFNLSFDKSLEVMEITIEDNGIGIPKEKTNAFGNGLKNMKKRIKDINGIIQFENNQGTIIFIKVPLKIERDDII